jgi:hypothetical protein
VPNNGECVIENNYYIKDTQAVKLPENQNFIPLYASQIVYDILEKTLNNKLLPKYKIETTSDLHRTTKSKFISNFQSEEYCHKLIHTPTQTVWSKIPHKFQDGWKVFIPLTNQYSTFIEASGMTQSIAFIRCKTREEALKIKEELDSDIYKFLNNITRYGNFNNIRILQNFPLLSSFSLTKAEMDFVKHFNEKYYSKNCRKNYVKKEE